MKVCSAQLFDKSGFGRVILDDSYMAYMAAGGVIEKQLSKAAYRTAMHLNKIFG